MSNLRQRRKSVIDLCKNELTAFSNRVGKDDKARIQAHFESVRQMEIDIDAAAAMPPGMCTAPANTPTGLAFGQVANYPAQVKLMLDIVAAAVKCDLARTVTVDLIDDGGGNSLTFPWLMLNSPDYHAISHSGSSAFTQKTKIDTWYYTQVASLVKQLAEFTEGTGSALDHTAVLVANDMNQGDFHDVTSIPFVLLGSCGGFFKTGRVVSLPKVPHNHLLTTVCHAMGVDTPGVGPTAYAGNVDAMLTA